MMHDAAAVKRLAMLQRIWSVTAGNPPRQRRRSFIVVEYFVMPSVSRRRLLLGSVPFLGLSSLAYARLIEPSWLETTRRSCAVPRLRAPVDVVHLSDLHASEIVPKALIEEALEQAAALTPDLICITGDFVTRARGFDSNWYAAALGRLAQKAPTFAVLGNHDGGLWAAGAGGYGTPLEVTTLLERSGIAVLTNRMQSLTVRGQKLQVLGVGDMWSGELHAALAFEQAKPDVPTVLLSHNPDSKALLASYDWDVMLSGHTHGGQVVVPGIGASPAPVWDRGDISGLKTWRGRWIHISRGVGSIAGVRFNCRPEVTHLRLEPHHVHAP